MYPRSALIVTDDVDDDDDDDVAATAGAAGAAYPERCLSVHEAHRLRSQLTQINTNARIEHDVHDLSLALKSAKNRSFAQFSQTTCDLFEFELELAATSTAAVVDTSTSLSLSSFASRSLITALVARCRSAPWFWPRQSPWPHRAAAFWQQCRTCGRADATDP